MKRIIRSLVVINVLIFIAACGSDQTEKATTAKEMYEKAVKYYNDEDYMEAEKLFDAVRLQYTASQYSDDAQYYIAEINFKRYEYILSAFNYNRLRSQYPGSDYTQSALYKEALSYYELSPTYHRDQKYTRKAIDAFKEFKYLYPDNDSLVNKSNIRINELRAKLAKKDYSIAELYMNMDDPRAALVYFDQVINKYDDTKYYQDAFYGKIKALIKMKKFQEARSIIRSYKSDFPGGEYIRDVKDLENEHF